MTVQAPPQLIERIGTLGKLFDALTAVKDSVEEGVSFDALIERCDETIDSQLIYTSDIVAMWTELGCPDPSDADKSDEIMPLMTFAVYEGLRDNTDVERIVTEYVLDEHTILCDACAVAVVNDDYSAGADAEVIQAFYTELGRGDRHLVWCGSIEEGFNGVCNACCDRLEYSTASIFTLV